MTDGKKDALALPGARSGGGSALARLSALTQGGVDEASVEDDAERVEQMSKLLDLASEIADGDIFEMQALIEDCGRELQVQIREMVEGDEEDED